LISRILAAFAAAAACGTEFAAEFVSSGSSAETIERMASSEGRAYRSVIRVEV
jgi:hypothetical protein